MSNETPLNHDAPLRTRDGDTPYTHYTTVCDGDLLSRVEGFDCRIGPAILSMKCWASDEREAMDLPGAFAQSVNFKIRTKVDLSSTEAEEPSRENPFGYGISLMAYEVDA